MTAQGNGTGDAAEPRMASAGRGVGCGLGGAGAAVAVSSAWVERLFAWLHWFSGLVVRYEFHAENFLGMVRL